MTAILAIVLWLAMLVFMLACIHKAPPSPPR